MSSYSTVYYLDDITHNEEVSYHSILQSKQEAYNPVVS